MKDAQEILPRFVGQCGLSCLWHEGDCRDQLEEQCAARAAEIMDPKHEEAKPKLDCKKCLGSGVVESLDFPGRTVPCSECFSAPTFIAKLFDDMVKADKERDDDDEGEDR